MQKFLDLFLYASVAMLAVVSVKEGIRHKSLLIAAGGLALCGVVLFVCLTSPLRVVG